VAGSLVWRVALWTQPQKPFATAFGHLGGRWIAEVPLPGHPGVILHRPTGAEPFHLAFAVWADYIVTSLICQVTYPGLPLMVPAAFMNAAWAAQADSLIAFVGEIGWHLAQIEGGVPHALNGLVVRVRQALLSLSIKSYACIKCAD